MQEPSPVWSAIIFANGAQRHVKAPFLAHVDFLWSRCIVCNAWKKVLVSCGAVTKSFFFLGGEAEAVWGGGGGGEAEAVWGEASPPHTP